MQTDEKKQIGKLFDRIAGHYDRLNHILSLNIDKCWRKRLVRSMHPTDHVLDVAIGTADLAIAMCRQHRAQQVTGIDLSTEMMRIGQTKAAGMPISFVEGSALAMPFEKESFDAVTCSFGCRNFSDLAQGLSEMYRVLRTDGQVCILEFSYPDNALIRTLYDLYFTHLLPHIGAWMSHDKSAYTYLNRSVKHFIWGEAFDEQLRHAGFTDVHHQPLTFGIATIYYGYKR